MNNINPKAITYQKAFKETYLIINNLSDDLYVKIPKSFVKTIKDNMDQNYNITLDELNTKGEMQETKVLMSLIFRDFLCNEELRNKLKEYDKKQIKQEVEQYNNIFDNNIQELKDESITTSEEIEVIEKKQTTELVNISKQTWYQKLLNKIKNFFFKK